MAKTAGGFVPPIQFDRTLRVPLHRQLCNALRAQILDGRIVPGTRLPSTRMLAQDWGLSRNTVLNCFEQLLAEGFLEGKVGAGTWLRAQSPLIYFDAGEHRGWCTRLPPLSPTPLGFLGTSQPGAW